MTTPFWAMLLMLIGSILSAFATFNIKIASAQISLSIKKTLKTKRLWAGILLYGLTVIISLFAFKAGALSVLYPIGSLQYAWTVLISRKYLGEEIKPLKWAGIAMIILGVTIIGLGAR